MYDTDEFYLMQRIRNLPEVYRTRSDADFLQELVMLLLEIVEAIPKTTDPGQE